MELYENQQTGAEIHYPASMDSNYSAEIPAVDFDAAGRLGQFLAFEVYEVPEDQVPMTVDSYFEVSPAAQQLPLESLQVTSSGEMETESGLTVTVQEFEAHDGWTKGMRMAYVMNGNTAIGFFYYAPATVFDEWQETVEYSFGTFRLTGE